MQNFNLSNADPATERQLDYLRKLGVEVSDEIAKAEASDLIDNALEKREPGGERDFALARAFDVPYTRFSSKKSVFTSIVSTLYRQDRTEDLALWYVYRVYRDIVDRRKVPTPPALEAFRPIAQDLLLDEKFVSSLKKAASRDGVDFRWFGEYTTTDGWVHTGESRRTHAYIAASARLRDMEGCGGPRRKHVADARQSIDKTDQAALGGGFVEWIKKAALYVFTFVMSIIVIFALIVLSKYLF
ncbi:hypothetical protein [Amorphus sp. 3PC139-8]|uniref:hypothetical protein n=1 Tax=Amorphus sp. 3PC139-8 TaxID=2735676 RepID=UPI00345DF0E3